MQTKKRLYEFDIMRTIATYSVIIVHITALLLTDYNTEGVSSGFLIGLNRYLKFTVPIFIFLAGAMINKKYSNEDFKTIPFYASKIKSVIIPYFVFCVVYYLYACRADLSSISIKTFITLFISGKASYHLYFIIILSQLYLMTPLLVKLIKNPLRYRVRLCLLFSLISFFSNEWMMFEYNDRFFSKYLFAYMLGVLIGTDLWSVLFSKASKIFILTLWFLEGLTYSIDFYHIFYTGKAYLEGYSSQIWFFYTHLSIFAIYIISDHLKENEKVKNICKKVSSFSFYVYLIHPLYIHIFYRYFKSISHIGIRLISFTAFIVISSTVTAMIIVKALKRTNKEKEKDNLSA